MLTFGNSISIEEYSELRLSVGWTPLVEDQERSGLEHSDFIISCREEGHIVGCSRVFWDKGSRHFYVQYRIIVWACTERPSICWMISKRHIVYEIH